MPSPPRSPIDRIPAPFDPKILARSVIAIPLLDAIEHERAITEEFLKAHRHLRNKYNAAIFYTDETAKGAEAAWKAVRKLADKAAKEVNVQAVLTVEKPGAIVAGVSLAQLDGRVIRQLLALDAEQEKRLIAHIWPTRFEVIIDINLNFKPSDAALALTGVQTGPTPHPDSRRVAKDLIKKYIEEAISAEGVADPDQGVDNGKTELSNQYVFARLEGRVIQKLVAIDEQHTKELAIEEAAALLSAVQPAAAKPKKRKAKAVVKEEPPLDEARFRTIHHIWPDFRIQSCIMRSIATVKVDAAQRSFTALGEGITWAVMDSGIDADHPHFKAHGNIDRTSSYHADFTGAPTGPAPLKDDYGHGTHVAGIIAGEQIRTDDTPAKQMHAVCRELDQNNRPGFKELPLKQISGMAPKCKLVSLKVLDKFGQGNASNLIAAISHIQLINGHGREPHIHGVNISLGYPFEAKWFACGHSPLCVEINRLVKSGVVVVIAAGNTGYGTLKTKEGDSDACLDLTINDPGNAEYAITVGSTHRDMPHLYGVSYFSSKGPTGDGRCKPDLLAPGEKIVSCAAPNSKLVAKEVGDGEYGYFETSGTSMAAPHVSGVIAAFLSIRNEFIGESEKVKHIFTSTATDLGRDRSFQGHGLIDLMRAIQSV